MSGYGRVLVTGASGFIGRDLSARLARQGWQVRAAARDPKAIVALPGVEAVALGDLAGSPQWAPLLEGITHVVHLAGIAHATSTIPEAVYHAVNAEAVGTLGDAARRAGVTRVVLVSSIRAQCGASAEGVVDEMRAPAPDDPYGRSKLAGERVLAQALGDSATTWCVLRPVVLYGPGVKGNVATLARLARSHLPLPLGGLDARRSLLGLANFERATEHALTSAAAHHRTFIVADAGPLAMPEIVAAMRAGLGRGPGIVRLPLAPARLALRLAGKGQMWERIAGALVVSTAALEASGWRASETAEQGLGRWMRESSTAA
jgi:nucleoside-diphosphate-sugar epimerase